MACEPRMEIADEVPTSEDTIPNCPLGLEYLTQVSLAATFSVRETIASTTDPSWFQIDQLLVKQKRELMEILSGCEMKNKYIIKNTLGQQVYYAKEVRYSVERFGSDHPQ